MERKFFSGAVTAQAGDLGERQIKVVASDATKDRAGDILDPKGCKVLTDGAIIPVQLDHDATVKSNVGTAKISVTDSRVEALVTFHEAGKSAEADDACFKYKSGALNSVSVGFNPIASEPLKGGGVLFKEWDLMELSLVVVPCNPSATTIERAAPIKTKEAPKMKVKGLYDVAQLAYLLSSLGYIEENAEWEAEYEGDNSPVPAMLTEALKQLGAALVAMTVEEVSELLGEEGETDKAGAIAKVKTFSRIIKAGRALSAANESEIRAACELMEGATGKLAGVLDAVAADDDGAEKSAVDMEQFRRRARIAALVA